MEKTKHKKQTNKKHTKKQQQQIKNNYKQLEC